MNKSDSTPAGEDTWHEHAKLRLLNRVFLIVIVAGLAIAVSAAAAIHALAVPLWALASLAVGALVGLLFGIPRMRQKLTAEADGAATSNYTPEINNNLIEVSDWLTKIIVGVGLVELHSLPEKLLRVARPLAACLDIECGLAIAVGVIVFFTAAGFLAGYINARTFLAVMIKDSDDRLFAKVSALESKVQDTAVSQQVQQAAATLQLQGVRRLVENQAASANRSVAESRPGEALQKLARRYESIEDPSYQVRVARKEEVANEITRYILDAKIPKAALLEWVEADPSDGRILTYASYVAAMPEPGDLAGLLRVAPHAKWLHVKFRVALALRALATDDYGNRDGWEGALNVLQRFHRDAEDRQDPPLQRLTSAVADLIRPKLA